jgi:predicted HicB family RNase H-like nuclease
MREIKIAKLDYDGYSINMMYNKIDNIYYGKISNILDCIQVQGTTLKAFEKDFHLAVKEYKQDLKKLKRKK